MSRRSGDDQRRAAPGTPVVYKDGTHGWIDDPGLPPDASHDVTKEEKLRRAREDRDALLSEEVWYTSKQVAERAPDTLAEGGPDEYTSQLRSQRRLFGVRFRGQYLHPAFQFQPNGEMHPAMAEVLKILPCTDANWYAAFWWFQPTGLLGGRRPADVFQAEPRRVVSAADHDFVRGDEF